MCSLASMSNYNQPQGYPAAAAGTAYQKDGGQGGNMVPLPPPAYPTRKDGEEGGEGAAAATHTQSRGDGFWRGCCAGVCCCCLLDACF